VKREYNKHTISVQYHILSVKYSYYILGLSIVTKGDHSKGASNDQTEFAKAVSLIIQYILFTLEENDLHQRSKPTGPGMASNPHWFGPPSDTPHQHRWKEEEDPHLHTRDNKSKA
jgi:hypothetical protein